MALSLDDVVFGIYDAYKTTEDEQIKQGLLKQRVHPDDFSASLKRQLKGLTDDELIAISELLKEKISNSNINDIVYAQNGVVNINIPQSMINQGIDNAKFRRRGVSGASLEHESIAETMIKTAGVVSIAELYGERIKPEQIQHLFGGLDMNSAIEIAKSINHSEFAANNVPNFENNNDAMQVIFNNLPFGGMIDSKSFFDDKKVSSKDRVLLFANMSKLFNFFDVVAAKGFDAALNSNQFQELLQSGLTLEKLEGMGFSQEVITNLSTNPEFLKEFNETLKEKQDFYRQPEVMAIFRQEITQIIRANDPNISETELENILNNPLMRDVILNSFGLDGKGGFAYSPELIAASIGKVIEAQRNFEGRSGIPKYNNKINSKQYEHLTSSDQDVVSEETPKNEYDSYNRDNYHQHTSTSQQTAYQKLKYEYNRYRTDRNHKSPSDKHKTNISTQQYTVVSYSPDTSTSQMQVEGYPDVDASSFFMSQIQNGSFDIRTTDDRLADFDDSTLDDPTFTEYKPNTFEIQQSEAEGPLSDRAEDMLVDEEFKQKTSYKQDIPAESNENAIINSSGKSNNSPSTDSNSSSSSSTSSNNTGMIVSEDKSAATIGGFWSNFMRHMREDNESKGLFGKIRSAFRKAREDSDKANGFAVEEDSTSTSESSGSTEELTEQEAFNKSLFVDTSKSTPIAPQPEKSTTDTKEQKPEEPTQDNDEQIM